MVVVAVALVPLAPPKVATANGEPLSKNVTVPVGAAVPEAAVTVAVKPFTMPSGDGEFTRTTRVPDGWVFVKTAVNVLAEVLIAVTVTFSLLERLASTDSWLPTTMPVSEATATVCEPVAVMAAVVLVEIGARVVVVAVPTMLSVNADDVLGPKAAKGPPESGVKVATIWSPFCKAKPDGAVGKLLALTAALAKPVPTVLLGVTWIAFDG